MATKNLNLGIVPVSRGEFNLDTIYYKDNIVQYKGGSYQVVSESSIIGVPPTNDKNVVNPEWILFAGAIDAQDVSSNIEGLEGSDVQANLNDVSNKLSELDFAKRYVKDYTPLASIINAPKGSNIYSNIKLLAGNTYIITNKSIATLSIALSASPTEYSSIESYGNIVSNTDKEIIPSSDGYLYVYVNDINSFTVECKNEVYYKVNKNTSNINKLSSDLSVSKEELQHKIDGNSRSIDSVENTIGERKVFEKEQEGSAHSVFPFVFEKGKTYTIVNNGNGGIEPKLVSELSVDGPFVQMLDVVIKPYGQSFTFECTHDAVGFAGWMQNTSISIEVYMNGSIKESLISLEKTLISHEDKIIDNKYYIDNLNKVIGKADLKYKVLHDKKYINSKGVLVSQDNSIVTQPIQLYAGDIIRMVVPDTGLCIIAEFINNGFKPIFNYKGRNTEQYYKVKEDIEVCFTVIEGSDINIIKEKGLYSDVVNLKNDVGLVLNKTMSIKANSEVQRFIYDCNLKKGDFVYIKFKETKINTVAIALLDSSDNSVFSSGNLDMYQFPYKICVPKDCKKIQLALWQPYWVDVEGDMQVSVIKYKSDNISIEDSLQSDGNSAAGLEMVNCRMIKDGNHSINNYGKDGVKYEFDIANKFNKLYLYFEWQAISALDNTTSPLVVAKLLDGMVRNYYYIGDMRQSVNGNIYRDTKYGHHKEGDDRVYEFEIPSGSENYIFSDAYFSFAGKDAIWVRYTGDTSKNAFIKVTDTSMICTVDGTSDTINFSADTSLDNVISALNNLSYIEAGTFLGSEHTFGELLKNEELSISLVQEINDGGNTARVALRRYLTFAHDDRWHTCEILVNIPKKEAAFNHDGFTTFVALPKDILKVLENRYSTICLGDSVADANCSIRFRNLDLKVDSDGDAEIVNYQWTAPDPTIGVWRKYLRQLISPRNPKIVLYECHDVIVGDDTDVNPSDIGFVTEAGMSATTGRLSKMFDYAKSHGYSFVTWEDIYNWKMFGKKLPKRCMNIMFDDFRIGIYLDYDKRKPFIQYGVKPALAVITSKNKNLDEEVEFNGLRCTYREGLQMIRNAGWYMASHSYNHTERLFDSFEKRMQDIKEDAIMADKYGVRMEIYATPFRNYEHVEYSLFKSSSIGCIVSGVVPDYICKGSNNFCLNRTELGLRVPYKDVIAPLR